MHGSLSYPEIEATALNHTREVEQVYSRYQPPTTLVDLLEINLSPGGEVYWNEGLDHESLINHFRGTDLSRAVSAPALRIFFLGSMEFESSSMEMFKELDVFHCARLHPSTAYWMRDRFAVSPIFLNCVIAGHLVLKTGSVSFLKRDKNENVITIAGFYRYSCGVHGGQAHAWFSHDLRTDSSTYILDNCPDVAKRLILGCALGDHPDALGRPCAIDALISEDCGQAWGKEMLMFRNELLRYEYMRFALQRLSPAETSSAVEKLHYISQNLHRISEDVTDLEERLDFLRGVHTQYITYSTRPQEKESVAESLQFLASRTRIWKRWAMNYKDRTEIRINLFFNLATQSDNRTNLDIASFTSKIAVDTQRDSSSMITIATLTMLFLPGTFVSAIFSMVFFNPAAESNGRATITVSPQWWIFVAITIPLTIIVFIVWIIWQRWRNGVKGIHLTDSFAEKV